MNRNNGSATGRRIGASTLVASTTLAAMLAVWWCTVRPALAAPPRRVAHAAQTDLGEIARRLPLHGSLRVEGVQFEGATTALELERFEAFAPDAQIVIAGDHGDVVLPAPDNAYYRGAVEGDLGAVAVLTARAKGGVRGLIVKNGIPWVIGDQPGPTRLPGLSTRKVDFAQEFAGHPFRCGADEASKTPAALDPQAAGLAAPVTADTVVNYTARVAVETDYEFFQLFANSIDPTTDATDYVGDLFAYASTIYESEINTSLMVSYLKLWTTSADPWVQTSCGSVLTEFQNYWNANNTGVSRTTAHMLSGKPTGCGIAYIGGLCSNSWGYGVSGSLSGSFDIKNPGVVWDILVVSHEIGHNFNTPHTHCYNGIGGSPQPVDQCYSGESGCYSGPTSLPCSLGPGHGCGTIMSYCHLLNGAYGNTTLTFGTGFAYGVLPGRVPTRMHDYVVSTAAAYPGCLQYVPPGPTLTPTMSGTPTATLVATATPTASLTRSSTTTPTQAPTSTSTATRTVTPTATLTATFTPTLAATATRTPTNTATLPPTRTLTPTVPPTLSPIPTNSVTPTSTRTATLVPTFTRTATLAPTLTPISTATPTATGGAACPQTDLGNAVPVAYSGSTVGARNSMAGASCGGGGNSAPDASFLFTAPATGTYQIDTLGSAFDTVLYVRNATCAGAQLACNDDANGTLQSLVTVPLSTGQSVVIVVDGFSTRSGAFTLNVRLVSAATPAPTLTPASSATPRATNTATPAATATYTAASVPTLTPVPTNTALPTLTSVPTNTAVPTLTSVPTNTVGPTLTSTVANTAAPTSTLTPTSVPPPSSSPTPAPAGTTTPVPPLQLLAVQDAWIDEANPTHNRGNDVNLSVYPVSNKRHHSLVQFDLSQVPAGACMSSATLMLTLTTTQSPAQTFGVHRLTQSWSEGNGADNSGVTWSSRDGLTSWTTPGGDFAAAATASVSTGITTGVTLQWNVTADVAAFRAGWVVNYGWLVKDINEGSGKLFRFASREASTIGSRPQLQITFAPCP